MRAKTTRHEAGFQIFTIESGDNIFELTEFGAQLISWEKSGLPILFANRDHAFLDGKTPYRGGAPICFPWFGKGTLLSSEPLSFPLTPQHGPARTTIWQSAVDDSSVMFSATFESFACNLTYRFTDDLDLEVSIQNLGAEAEPLQFVVHSYWACQKPTAARVYGLGQPYLDNLQEYRAFEDSKPDEPHDLPVDRVYINPSPHLEIDTGDTRIKIEANAFDSAVLWNPGPSHSIRDLGSTNFICVENGIIIPAPSLPPGSRLGANLHVSAALAS